MLENLAGTEGLPSPELIRDLRTLCGLGRRELAGIADAVASMPQEPTEEDIADAILPKLRTVKADPEKLTSAVRVALFLWSRWARYALTKQQIASDLQGLDITPEQLENVTPLLDAMQAKLGVLQRERADQQALGTGTPRIDSAACVVDARAVFKSSQYEKDAGDQQPYFDFERFVPIVILEIISELNDDKTTQAYLLNERTLEQLCDILERARKRLRLVQKRLSSSSEHEEAQND